MSRRGRMPAKAIIQGADVRVRDYMAIRAGESVVITADTATDPTLVETLLTAVEQAEARGAVVTIPRLPYQGGLADPYVPPAVAGAVAECDAWIDLTFPYLAGSRVCDETLQRGRARYLLGGDMGHPHGVWRVWRPAVRRRADHPPPEPVEAASGRR